MSAGAQDNETEPQEKDRLLTKTRGRSLVVACVVVLVSVGTVLGVREMTRTPENDVKVPTTSDATVHPAVQDEPLGDAAAPLEDEQSDPRVETPDTASSVDRPATQFEGMSPSPVGDIDVLPMPLVGPVVSPVSLDETASFGNGVTARVVSTESLTVTGKVPGETTGPAVAVTIELHNASGSPLALENVTVDLTDSEGRSLNRIDSASEYEELIGSVESGGSLSGTYVFRIEPNSGSTNYLTVKYTTDTPTVVFAGRINNE